MGYYWPIMKANVKSNVRRSQACQLYSNLIHALTIELHSLSTSWSFSGPSILLIQCLEVTYESLQLKCSTKWLDAIALKQASRAIAASFIDVTWFAGLAFLSVFLSVNVTKFVKSYVR